MFVKGIKEEDFANYKKPSMFIIFPYCSFKCDKECGRPVCQNSELASAPVISVPALTIVEKYVSNPITKAIVFGGLEPFDSYEDMIKLIKKFRNQTRDTIVIYTGYKEEELADRLKEVAKYPNIIIKFGRFIPDDVPVYDKILGIALSSHNQYAKIIS